LAWFLRAGGMDAAVRIALHAQHESHDFLQWHFGGALLAFEVKLRGLIVRHVAPEMLSLLIVVNRRDRLLRKEGNPVTAVETAFNDQISRANIGHGPLVMTNGFAHRYSCVWSKKSTIS
jgi:hypothetical protein